MCGLTQWTTLILAILIPSYASYKIIVESTYKSYECERLLMFWVVFGIFKSAEWITDQYFWWFPFYDEMKLIALLWFYYFAGAEHLYRQILDPIFEENHDVLQHAMTSTNDAFKEFK